ncbi:MAG: DUF502 domain-containing protein [Hyphomicrobiaceae bacterium]|nr:MAG: DUF502 domain-containing protein [Hyphomicrobiaceae bacterium]
MQGKLIKDKETPRAPDSPSAPLVDSEVDKSWHIGARLRNYLITGLVVAGPIAITIYVVRLAISSVDGWVKPWLPNTYNPDKYLPFEIPGVGLVIAILGLMLIGALTANLIGRTLLSSGEMMLGRMPIVRNVYGLVKQIFESVASVRGQSRFQKVGLLQFPAKGVWSIVFVTSEAAHEVKQRLPSEEDLVTVFVPTGFVPPTGFVCFVPRRDVTFINMTVEDAARIIVSGGMAGPEQSKIKALAAKAVPPEVAAAMKAATLEPGTRPLT